MKKIYSTPEVTLHKYDLSPLMDAIGTVSDNADNERQSKGTGGGGGIDWDAFDNDTEE